MRILIFLFLVWIVLPLTACYSGGKSLVVIPDDKNLIKELYSIYPPDQSSITTGLTTIQVVDESQGKYLGWEVELSIWDGNYYKFHSNVPQVDDTTWGTTLDLESGHYALLVKGQQKWWFYTYFVVE